jgi:hypothetical protein
VAGAEIMLLHVQQAATVRSHPFPAPVEASLAALLEASRGLKAEVPASRVMTLRPPSPDPGSGQQP